MAMSNHLRSLQCSKINKDDIFALDNDIDSGENHYVQSLDSRSAEWLRISYMLRLFDSFVRFACLLPLRLGKLNRVEFSLEL
eukprot:665721-Amphidinium_carterae.1